MSDKDLLERFIFDKASVRGEYVHLQNSFQTIVQQHQYPAPIRQLLGEALAVAALLSAIIKFDGRLTVQFRGKGNLKLLLAQCDNHFQIRGLAKWDGELSYEELMDSFKEGVLMIMLDSGLKNRYQGIVNWSGNSLAESIEGYFRDSEQLATRIWLTVDENAAAGLLLQVIPSSDKNMSALEKAAVDPHWDRITRLTNQLYPEDMLRMDYQTLLRSLYPDEEVRIFDGVPVRFHCTCSRQKGEDAIALLGREEAEEELKNRQTIVVTCDFCNKEYVFDRMDVSNIFDGKSTPPPDTQLH